MQCGTGEATNARTGFTVQNGNIVGIQQQRRTQRVCRRDKVNDTAFARLTRLGHAQRIHDHVKLTGIGVGRQFDADAGLRLGRGHAAAVRALAVADGLEVLCELGGVVGRRRRVGDVRTAQVHLHSQAQVFVHLGRVGDQRVRHGDLVGRARHREDKGLFGRRVRAQVPLADDFVDDAQVFRQRQW